MNNSSGMEDTNLASEGMNEDREDTISASEGIEDTNLASEGMNEDTDLPLMCNYGDIQVKHYILKLTCHPGRQILTGSVVMICEPCQCPSCGAPMTENDHMYSQGKSGGAPVTDKDKDHEESRSCGAPVSNKDHDHEGPCGVSVSNKDHDLEGPCGAPVSNKNHDHEGPCGAPVSNKIHDHEGSCGVPVSNKNHDHEGPCGAPVSNKDHDHEYSCCVPVCVEDHVVKQTSCDLSLSLIDKTQSCTTVSSHNNKINIETNEACQQESISACNLLKHTKRPTEELNISDVDHCHSGCKKVRPHPTDINPFTPTDRFRSTQNNEWKGQLQLPSVNCPFTMTLDSYDIEIHSVEAIEKIPNSCNLKQSYKDCISQVFDNQPAMQLQHRVEKHCIRIYKEGCVSRCQFPDVVRVNYSTRPGGHSLKWTKDQDDK